MGFRSLIRGWGLTSDIMGADIVIVNQPNDTMALERLRDRFAYDVDAVVYFRNRDWRFYIEKPPGLITGILSPNDQHNGFKPFQRMFTGKIRYIRPDPGFELLLPIFTNEIDYILWQSLSGVRDPGYWLNMSEYSQGARDMVYGMNLQKFNMLMGG